MAEGGFGPGAGNGGGFTAAVAAIGGPAAPAGSGAGGWDTHVYRYGERDPVPENLRGTGDAMEGRHPLDFRQTTQRRKSHEP
jgi:hypothetical protein